MKKLGSSKTKVDLNFAKTWREDVGRVVNRLLFGVDTQAVASGDGCCVKDRVLHGPIQSDRVGLRVGL